LFAKASSAIIPFAAIVLGLLLFTLFRPGLRPPRRKQRKGAAPGKDAAAAMEPEADGAGSRKETALN
jgi:hypothetical protein